MANKKPKKPKTYLELREIWYKKLERSGFKDIEDMTDRDGSKFSIKVTSHSHHLKNVKRDWESKTEYFSLAGQFLHNYRFKNNKDKVLWEYHANGLSLSDIAQIFKKAGLKPTSKSGVENRLKPLVAEMKRMYLVGYK